MGVADEILRKIIAAGGVAGNGIRVPQAAPGGLSDPNMPRYTPPKQPTSGNPRGILDQFLPAPVTPAGIAAAGAMAGRTGPPLAAEFQAQQAAQQAQIDNLLQYLLGGQQGGGPGGGGGGGGLSAQAYVDAVPAPYLTDLNAVRDAYNPAFDRANTFRGLASTAIENERQALVQRLAALQSDNASQDAARLADASQRSSQAVSQAAAPTNLIRDLQAQGASSQALEARGAQGVANAQAAGAREQTLLQRLASIQQDSTQNRTQNAAEVGQAAQSQLQNTSAQLISALLGQQSQAVGEAQKANQDALNEYQKEVAAAILQAQRDARGGGGGGGSSKQLSISDRIKVAEFLGQAFTTDQGGDISPLYGTLAQQIASQGDAGFQALNADILSGAIPIEVGQGIYDALAGGSQPKQPTAAQVGASIIASGGRAPSRSRRNKI